MKGKQIQGTTLWKNNNCKTNQCPPPKKKKKNGVGEKEAHTHTHTHTERVYSYI